MKYKRLFFAVLLVCLFTVSITEAAVDRIRLGIMRFESKTYGVSDRQAEIITDIFARTLSNSPSIVLIERERLDMIGREHKLNMSGLVDMGMAIEIGRLAGLQYLLLGSVTGLDEKDTVVDFIIRTHTREAEATIDIRIVDVTTAEVILSLAQTGSYTQKSESFSSRSSTTYVQTDLSDIKARAIENAASRLGHRIREVLAEEYAQVITAGDKTINIDLGATSGVRMGDLYLVYAEGMVITDSYGRLLGRERQPIAVVRVQSVSSGFSTCETVADGGKISLIRKGDKIEPISSSESQALAKRKAFPSDRPKARAYDATAAALFGGGTNDTPPSLTSNSELPTPPPSQPQTQLQPPVNTSGLENDSTDPAKVIKSYSLDMGEENMRRLTHVNAQRLLNSTKKTDWQQAYNTYTELVNSYSGDYLAAYQAGEAARKLKNNDDAKMWYDRALTINPNYKPAAAARAKIK